MFSSVDLPEPDGPTMATNSPGLDLEVDPLQRLDLDRAGVVDLAQVAHVDDRRGRLHDRDLLTVPSDEQVHDPLPHS